MSRNKRPDVYPQMRIDRHEAETRRQYIEEKYPNVAELKIKSRFEDGDGVCQPKEQERVFKSTQRAYFDLPCPFKECVHGGFDLLGAVDDAVRAGQLESSGTAICMGWQDRERVNKHRCRLKMTYEIQVQYH